MKLCDPFEYKGYWWKPDDPDNKVAGVLTYKPGESITLELIGTFDLMTLMTIYDKSDIDNVSDAYLRSLVQEIEGK